jgi:hypothetical protein
VKFQSLFDTAIERIDAANGEDPRRELADGKPEPREWLFGRRVYDWVRRLRPAASEELLLAARAHTLRRWMIPRERYPQTTIGYHQWRDALAAFHAEQAESILREVGYPSERVDAVKTKLAGYIDAWGDAKTIRILKRTIRKMTPEARAKALQLNLAERERELVRRAV